MKKVWGLMTALIFCGAFLGAPALYAEDSSSSTMSLKDQLEADKAAIKAQREENKANAQTARSEEKALREQIRAARQSGDTAKVSELEAQLKTTHKGNIQERKEDRKEMRDAKKELRQDRHAARASRRR